jgi:hypothetical protein
MPVPLGPVEAIAYHTDKVFAAVELPDDPVLERGNLDRLSLKIPALGENTVYPYGSPPGGDG